MSATLSEKSINTNLCGAGSELVSVSLSLPLSFKAAAMAPGETPLSSLRGLGGADWEGRRSPSRLMLDAGIGAAGARFTAIWERCHSKTWFKIALYRKAKVCCHQLTVWDLA